MKNKREDRFEAIVDQFVKNDLIAQEEYSYYLYGVKHLEVLIMTTGGVLLSGILLKEILFTVVFLITFSLLRIGWQGIHAKTKIRCFCYSLLLFLSGIYVKKQVVRSIDLFSQAVFMGSMLIILLLTALWKYKIDGKLNELKRCFWILGGVSLAIVLDIFVKSEAVMCGIGYSCFAMILLWFISMVRTKECDHIRNDMDCSKIRDTVRRNDRNRSGRNCRVYAVCISSVGVLCGRVQIR